MSAALEISQGFPVEGQPYETPPQSLDNQEPRYVTELGSFIEPTTAQERHWTAQGGIEVSNPCLRFARHFIRKGRITPVLKDRHEPCSLDYWDKATGKDASYVQGVIPPGYVAPLNEHGRPSTPKTLMYKLALPGEQIDSIVNGSANVFNRSRRGVIEIKSLKGQPYNPQPLGDGLVTDAAIWQIQRTIFPTYPVLPILLDETEELLEAAKVHTLLRSIVDDMLRSLSDFRDHAMATVEQVHYTMREVGGKSENGYIPRYTDLDFVLLEQLGMTRQDRNIRKEVPASDPDLKAAMAQLIQLQIEEKQANIDREKRLSQVTPIDQNTMAAAPIAEPDKEVRMWTCEHCGEEMKATSKGFHVGRHCPVLHPKIEELKAEEPVEEGETIPNLDQLSFNTRMRLGNPRAQAPNDLQLLNQISTEVRTIKRHKHNTGNVWDFNDCLIDVTSGEGTYQITQSDFGTPLAVLSWAPELPTWIARLIPIVQPQNMAFNYSLPNNASAWNWTWDGSNCTALRCAFYWRNNIPFIEFLPVPQLVAQYKIRYLQSANGVNQLALDESPVSNEDADVVETRAALAMLSISEWYSPDTKDGRQCNAERRKDLLVTLTTTERELRRQFEAAQLTPEGPRQSMRWQGCLDG